MMAGLYVGLLVLLDIHAQVVSDRDTMLHLITAKPADALSCVTVDILCCPKFLACTCRPLAMLRSRLT